MDERIKKLLGDGPHPFPVKDIGSQNIIDAYLGQGMIVLSPKTSMDMPAGSHAHDSYEFLIPLSDMPHSTIEKKVIYIEKDKLFPINAQQFHGPAREVFDCKLLAFQIDKDTFNQVSMSVCKMSQVSFENENMVIGNEIQYMLQMFMAEVKNPQAGHDFIMQNLVNLIIVNLLRQLKSNIPKLITERNYCEKENINRAISYLREQYNKDYSLDCVAGIANLSPYHFIRIFKSMTGKTPYDYLLEVKVEKAMELLRQKNRMVTEVCFLCGFSNLEHFASVFKRKTGMLPSQYKKLYA